MIMGGRAVVPLPETPLDPVEPFCVVELMVPVFEEVPLPDLGLEGVGF